jgi:hypothetical protein
MRNQTCKKHRISSNGFVYSRFLPITSRNFTAHPFPKYQATCWDLYLDFEKTFNKVSHSLLLVKLEHSGIRGSLLKWISAFLSNRKFYAKIGSLSSAVQDVVSGVPQGSVLGPPMFLVYISDLTLQLRSRHALFADDCKIYATTANANKI